MYTYRMSLPIYEGWYACGGKDLPDHLFVDLNGTVFLQSPVMLFLLHDIIQLKHIPVSFKSNFERNRSTCLFLNICT